MTTVRAAGPADAHAIARIEEAAAHAPWSPTSVAGHFAAEQPAWVVEAPGGEVVGHLLSQVAVDEAEVLTVAVHPAWRRRGLAARLLAHAGQAWKRRGVRRAFLEVRDDNHPARRLYEGAGWSHVGCRSAYYRDGCSAALYRWEVQ